jgi:hypothetical protein
LTSFVMKPSTIPKAKPKRYKNRPSYSDPYRTPEASSILCCVFPFL